MLDLRLKTSGKSAYPLRGLLIPGASPLHWVREIQRMGLSLENAPAYPIPGDAPHSLWGCLIEVEWARNKPDLGRNIPCQLLFDLLFIPEKTKLYPELSPQAAQTFFLSKKHAFHPEFNMVELNGPIRWEDLIVPPEALPAAVRAPEPPVFIPARTKNFQLIRLDPQAVLEKFTQQLFSLQERKPPIGYQQLLQMLDDDPIEALKYAIPLDEAGTARGAVITGDFELNERWSDFSLSENPSGKGGSTRLSPGDYFALRERYRKIASNLQNTGEHQKAAFVYFRLLKDYDNAARALRDGKYYVEAASIFLKYRNDKKNAAHCYELAKMTQEAIHLYIETGMREKAGDLYMSLGEREEAFRQYTQAVQILVSKYDYLDAAAICKDKMGDLDAAQSLLFQGWTENYDPLNCLSGYFRNIHKDEDFLDKMQEIYAGGFDGAIWISFLKAIQYECGLRPALASAIRSIAHEIIIAQKDDYPWVISELGPYQPDDPLIAKDVKLFKIATS